MRHSDRLLAAHCTRCGKPTPAGAGYQNRDTGDRFCTLACAVGTPMVQKAMSLLGGRLGAALMAEPTLAGQEGGDHADQA